jgi:hypothetical protein
MNFDSKPEGELVDEEVVGELVDEEELVGELEDEIAAKVDSKFCDFSLVFAV